MRPTEWLATTRSGATRTRNNPESMNTFKLALKLCGICSTIFLSFSIFAADNQAPTGYASLFNGKNLDGWKLPDGDGGHWKVIDGVIDYDAESQATGDKNL